MEIFAYSFLISVAVSLLSAGLYAALGKPSSKAGRKRQQQIIHGFQLGFGSVAGILIYAALMASVSVIFFDKTAALFSKVPVTRTLAYLLGIGALGIMAFTVQHWGKYVAGWIFLAAPKLLTVAMTGRFHGHSISRVVYLEMAGLFLITSLAIIRAVSDANFSIPDRIAILSWLLAFTFQANMGENEVRPVLVGTLALLLAGLYDYFRRHSKNRRRVTSESANS